MAGIIFWLCVLFVVYVYVGYPLLIAMLARLHPRPIRYAPGAPTVTLLIAAHNEERVIAGKIQNSLALDYPRDRLQILVANDGSTDGTAEILARYSDQGVEVWSTMPRRGKMAAINGAIQQARNEIVLFSDADNLYEPNTVHEIVKPFSDPSVGGASGARVAVGAHSLGKAEQLYWRYEEFIKRQESRFGSCAGVAGDALAIRRTLYTPPPASTINDDYFIFLSIVKQGYRVVFVPDARSAHPVTQTERGEIERRARMVAGRYQVMFSNARMLPFRDPVAAWQIISHKWLRPFVPIAVIIAMLANIVAFVFPSRLPAPGWLILSPPLVWATLLLEAIFFLLAGLGELVRLPGTIGKLLYLPTFLLNSNFAALKGFYRYAADRQTVMWNRPRDQVTVKKGDASPRR